MTGQPPVLLADIVLVVHFVIAAYITLSLPVIWLGGAAGWGFVRNRWFRWSHAGLMGIVLAETLADVLCPLTVWEADLRQLAGQDGGQSKSFVAQWLDRVLFLDLEPIWFTIAYGLFFGLVLLTLFLVPVQRPEKTAVSGRRENDNKLD